MKNKSKIYIFILGILCFTISQILIRIPILNLLNTNITINKFQILYPILYSLFLAFSAGIFEEGFRFLFRKYIIKNGSNKNYAIIFGLGHGLIEVAYLLFILISSGVNISTMNLLVAGYERVLAVIFHVGMTVFIWDGFLKAKENRNLLLAILFHGLFNSVPIFSDFIGGGFLLIYTILTIYCIIILIYIKKSRFNLGGK